MRHVLGGSGLALTLRTCAFVLERDPALGIGLVLDQRKVALGEAAGEQRDSFPQQDWNNPEIEFIDQVRFEEVAGLVRLRP